MAMKNLQINFIKDIMCHILKHTLELYRTVELELLQMHANLIKQLHVVIVNKIMQLYNNYNASMYTVRLEYVHNV